MSPSPSPVKEQGQTGWPVGVALPIGCFDCFSFSLCFPLSLFLFLFLLPFVSLGTYLCLCCYHCLFLSLFVFFSVYFCLLLPSLSLSVSVKGVLCSVGTSLHPYNTSKQVSPGSHPPRRNPTFSHQVAEESQPQGCSPWRVRCSDPDWNGALSVTAAAKAGRGPRTSPGTVGKPRLQRARSHWTVTEKRQALWSCFILQLSSPKLAGRGHRLSTVLCMRKVFPNHYLTHCRWKQKASLILHSDVWLSVDALRLSFSREERDASAHS